MCLIWRQNDSEHFHQTVKLDPKYAQFSLLFMSFCLIPECMSVQLSCARDRDRWSKKKKLDIFKLCEFKKQTYRAVVLQWCLQTLQLRWQSVMALGHQHDAIKTKRERETRPSYNMHKKHGRGTGSSRGSKAFLLKFTFGSWCLWSIQWVGRWIETQKGNSYFLIFIQCHHCHG